MPLSRALMGSVPAGFLIFPKLASRHCKMAHFSAAMRGPRKVLRLSPAEELSFSRIVGRCHHYASVSEVRCRNIRPLWGFATHKEANTPSVSECRTELVGQQVIFPFLMVREGILNHEIHGIHEIGEEGTGNGY